MRVLTNRDVEHEALTAKEHGSELPGISSRQMDISNQSPFSCRHFTTMHKTRVSIGLLALLLIVVIFIAILLSVFLSNINNEADIDSENAIRSGNIKQHDNNIFLSRANGGAKGIVLKHIRNIYIYIYIYNKFKLSLNFNMKSLLKHCFFCRKS